MLGCFYTSIFKSSDIILYSDDACLANSSTSEFWFLGTYVKTTWSNSWVRWFVNLRYFCILSSFASHSPFICPITNLESLWRSNFLAPKAFLILSLINMASYSASLLVVGNWSCTLYPRTSPSGVMMMTLTPPLFRADDPSVWIVHLFDSSRISFSSGIVNSTTKSTNACALIVVLGWYSMSNWLSLITHYSILPAASSLFIDFLIGWSIITLIGFA